MEPNELIKILPKFAIKGLSNLPQKLELCELKLTEQSIPYTQLEQVQAEITKFEPEQGWLCFQSDVEYFCKGEAIPTSSGILLYGEVSKSESEESLHIREDGQSGWILTHFIETEGDRYLKEKQLFLGEGKNLTPEKLHYHVYWQYNKEHGYHQYAARFVEF
jgi:hypothetical protein